jgi:hypothetical protein
MTPPPSCSSLTKRAKSQQRACRPWLSLQQAAARVRYTLLHMANSFQPDHFIVRSIMLAALTAMMTPGVFFVGYKGSRQVSLRVSDSYIGLHAFPSPPSMVFPHQTLAQP